MVVAASYLISAWHIKTKSYERIEGRIMEGDTDKRRKAGASFHGINGKRKKGLYPK